MLRKSNLVSLVLSLLLIVLLSACRPSLPNFFGTQTTNKLVVYVPGLTESLSTNDIAKNNGYGEDSSFFSSGAIQPYLQSTDAFKGSGSLVFSYRGFTDGGKPDSFPCSDTFNNQLLYDESLLNLQITQYLKAHQGTDVYIVAHSLGGVLAFGYLTQLIEQGTQSNAIEDLGKVLGHLKGVAIEDSPLGGVTNDSNYENAIIGRSLICPNETINYTTIGDLQTLFTTASSSSHQGETASILNAFMQGKYVTNQQVATDAAKKGIRILVVGNSNDILWQPSLCNAGSDFLSTEFLRELGEQNGGGALYVRSFPSGNASCSAVISNFANHVAVLQNTDVQKLIWEVFTGTSNNIVDKLTSVTDPSVLSASTTAIPMETPVPTDSPVPSNTPAPVDANAPTQQPVVQSEPTPVPPTAAPVPQPTAKPTPFHFYTPTPAPSASQALQINPNPLGLQGYCDGSSGIYVCMVKLTNLSQSDITWSASSPDAGVTINPSSGTLHPNEFTTIVVNIPNAPEIVNKEYGSITFTTNLGTVTLPWHVL